MKKHYLSVVSVVRDEDSYLPEWLEFHLFQGVNHFYIIEHMPKGKLRRLLDTYIQTGHVTYLKTYEEKPQLKEFQKALETYSADNEWLAFLDADEFLFAPGHLLAEGLKLMPENVGVYAVHRSVFGSNGHKHVTPGLIIERFTKRADLLSDRVKSVVRTDLASSAGNDPHTFYLKEGAIATRGFINDKHILPKEYARLDPLGNQPFRLHRYHCKSEIEYRRKKTYPDLHTGVVYASEQVNELFRVYDQNEVEDNLASIFAEEIKRNLKIRGLLNE